MANRHERLKSQFPEYAREIRALERSSRDFDDMASEYERLREEIHALEASGDVGLDYTILCNRRDSLQESLVIMMQEATAA
jgi:uncharacterized protein YdcH (DUF465 family)